MRMWDAGARAGGGALDERMNPLLEKRQAPSGLAELAQRGFNSARDFAAGDGFSLPRAVCGGGPGRGAPAKRRPSR